MFISLEFFTNEINGGNSWALIIIIHTRKPGYAVTGLSFNLIRLGLNFYRNISNFSGKLPKMVTKNGYWLLKSKIPYLNLLWFLLSFSDLYIQKL